MSSACCACRIEVPCAIVNAGFDGPASVSATAGVSCAVVLMLGGISLLLDVEVVVPRPAEVSPSSSSPVDPCFFFFFVIRNKPSFVTSETSQALSAKPRDVRSGYSWVFIPHSIGLDSHTLQYRK